MNLFFKKKVSGRPPVSRSTRQVGVVLVILLVGVPALLLLDKYAGWGGEATPPEEQAREVFAPLHQNIYRAFATPSEDAMYDVLWNSLEGPLLDEVYLEVYHYHRKFRRGGPKVEIEKVKLRHFEKMPSSESWRGQASFRVKCSWDVLSRITHYEHWHLRSNHYMAIYTLALFEGQWKLVEDEILWQQRRKLDLDSYRS